SSLLNPSGMVPLIKHSGDFSHNVARHRLFDPTTRLAATGLLIPYAAEPRPVDAHREWHRRLPAILQDSTRERRGTIFLTCTRICFTSLSVEADGLPARLALCQRVRQPCGRPSPCLPDSAPSRLA